MKWVSGLFTALALVAVVSAAAMMGDDPKGSDPSLVANLGWAGALGIVVGVALAVRAADVTARLSALVGLGGALCGVGCITAIGFAVGAERQNYWDAYHFAALFWAGAIASVAGVVALWRSRKESGLASFAFAPAAMVVLAYLLLWSWMTFEFVQEIEGAVVRWTWRLTHG
ncbi:MAG: hypothetical protein KDA24_03605 [Deltaproteobacteria bacterium]|nr:hypothetical protein [Deltaproteobacteria bacterium]